MLTFQTQTGTLYSLSKLWIQFRVCLGRERERGGKRDERLVAGVFRVRILLLRRQIEISVSSNPNHCCSYFVSSLCDGLLQFNSIRCLWHLSPILWYFSFTQFLLLALSFLIFRVVLIVLACSLIVGVFLAERWTFFLPILFCSLVRLDGIWLGSLNLMR